MYWVPTHYLLKYIVEVELGCDIYVYTYFEGKLLINVYVNLVLYQHSYKMDYLSMVFNFLFINVYLKLGIYHSLHKTGYVSMFI